MLHLLVLILLKHIGSAVKNLPAMRETWVRSLSWEDPLEKGMATDSCLENPHGQWEPGGLQSIGSQSQTQLTLSLKEI